MSPPVREIDLDRWPRRRHYELFRRYERPHWNVTAEVDVTALAAACGEPARRSFFLASLHLALRAVNEVEALRLRIRGDRVVDAGTVHGGSTLLLPDETFDFVYFEFFPRFERFAAAGRQVLERARRSPAAVAPRSDRDDLVHFSVLPWIRFSSFAHARRDGDNESVPKIVFGRHAPDGDGRRRMPVSVEVHHALVDGLHVGRFFERFQALLDRAGQELGG